MSYGKAINKQQSGVGSLFQKNFKRKHIDNERYFTSVVHYIDSNPLRHGICEDYRAYGHSSYNSILADKATKLQKQAILGWFGEKEGYLKLYEANFTEVKE